MRAQIESWLRLVLTITTLAALLGGPGLAEPIELSRNREGRVSIVVRDAPLAEVFEMLARKEQVNVLLGEDIEGEVSVNLFDVSIDRAVRAIADAAGYVAERRHGTYVIIERDNAGKDSAAGNTRIRAFKIEYSDPEPISDIVQKHLSRYGEVTVLEDRRLLVVEDLPGFLDRIERLLGEIDREPQLIFIEAKVLEIQLDEDEKIGIDWNTDSDSFTLGARDLALGDAAGLFFDLMRSDLEVQLTALQSKGRVRTLSTPTLLAVEHEEAEVVIGDRLGFRVTTTINQVTTESVEFLESGVILRFMASVDRDGRIVLDIHPEVSNGTISQGLPQQRTTEVTTRLRTESGQTVFIAGLIRESETDSRTGIPYAMDIPLLGRAFQRTETIDINTETVVLLTARIVQEPTRVEPAKTRETLDAERELEQSREERERRVFPVNPLTQDLGGVPLGGYEGPAPASVDEATPEPDEAAP
jgi:type II secretory pathway component GspD/PulD (secretin)